MIFLNKILTKCWWLYRGGQLFHDFSLIHSLFLAFQLRILLFHVFGIKNNDETYFRISTICRNFRTKEISQKCVASHAVQDGKELGKSDRAALSLLLVLYEIPVAVMVSQPCKLLFTYAEAEASFRAVYAASVNYQSNFHIRSAVARTQNCELVKSFIARPAMLAQLDCSSGSSHQCANFSRLLFFSPLVCYVHLGEYPRSCFRLREDILSFSSSFSGTGAYYVRQREIGSFNRPVEADFDRESPYSLSLSQTVQLPSTLTSFSQSASVGRLLLPFSRSAGLSLA